jgi:hypothetical protein
MWDYIEWRVGILLGPTAQLRGMLLISNSKDVYTGNHFCCSKGKLFNARV